MNQMKIKNQKTYYFILSFLCLTPPVFGSGESSYLDQVAPQQEKENYKDLILTFYKDLPKAKKGSYEKKMTQKPNAHSWSLLLELFEDLPKPKKIERLSEISQNSNIAPEKKLEIFKTFYTLYLKDTASDSVEARKNFTQKLLENFDLDQKCAVAKTYKTWGKEFKNERVQVLISIFKDPTCGERKKNLVSEKLKSLGCSDIVSSLWKEYQEQEAQTNQEDLVRGEGDIFRFTAKAGEMPKMIKYIPLDPDGTKSEDDWEALEKDEFDVVKSSPEIQKENENPTPAVFTKTGWLW